AGCHVDAVVVHVDGDCRRSCEVGMGDDIDGRAKQLAVNSYYGTEMIAEFLAAYPTLTDEEVQVCLQLGANQLLGELMRRLFTAGEVYRRMTGGEASNGATSAIAAIARIV